MIKIPLFHRSDSIKSKGKFALIDDEDFECVQFFNWSLSNGYAVNGIMKTALHVFLMSPETGFHVDHINGDMLDNRRSNLRIVTNSQNQMNRRPDSQTKSGYKGVHFDKGCVRPWSARIQLQGVYVRLGNFSTKEEAALAYNEAAINNYGPWARINIIRGI